MTRTVIRNSNVCVVSLKVDEKIATPSLYRCFNCCIYAMKILVILAFLTGFSEGNYREFSEKSTNFSDVILQASRNRNTALDDENRTKDAWIEMLKINILQQVGRSNSSTFGGGAQRYPPQNFTQQFQGSGDTIDETKRISTLYPECTQMESEHDDKLMNLFFNYTGDNTKIASAILRLYRTPIDLQDDLMHPSNCTDDVEEKLLRITAYWYFRNKRRVKKRLCDSVVIAETQKKVDLNVAQALKYWIKEAQNLGLTVQVEDQEGRYLKAEKYFKGFVCPSSSATVGVVSINDDESSKNGGGAESGPDDLTLPTLNVVTSRRRHLRHEKNNSTSTTFERKILIPRDKVLEMMKKINQT